jgi:HNH endonuclease
MAFATQSFSVEHIVPRYCGGKTTLDNLALSCQGCNGHKHIKVQGTDPVTKQVVPLFNPRQQLWQEHFAWSSDYTIVIGLTQAGRVTVKVLQMNRDGLMNLRRALFLLGDHPPRS